jgi:hypothetical protein
MSATSCQVVEHAAGGNDQREERVQALDLALRMLEQLASTGKPGLD